MTLKQRVLLWLLVSIPAIVLIAAGGSYYLAKHEIDELFDTQQLRLAEQALANATNLSAGGASTRLPRAASGHGEADPSDMAIAAWTSAGQLLSSPDPQVALPFKRVIDGFQRVKVNNEAWHLYYLSSTSGDRVVAVGQKAQERDEVLRQMLMSSLAPLALALPLLIIAIAFAVSRAFQPLETLTQELSGRPATDLSPISLKDAPDDLKPLVASMNALFDRIRAVIAHERRLTADASHELRSPIAALRAQWDAMVLTQDAKVKDSAMSKIDSSIDRLSRLVGQLLNLSTLESDETPRSFGQVRWHQVVENAISDVLPLIDQRNGDVSIDWPPDTVEPFPIRGDNALLSMMIRNLVDNSLRYGPSGTKVVINIQSDRLQVIDDGPGMPLEMIARQGERFVRPPGQQETGSGIGLSIINRVARLHGLDIDIQVPSDGEGSGTIVTFTRSGLNPQVNLSDASEHVTTTKTLAPDSSTGWPSKSQKQALNDEQFG